MAVSQGDGETTASIDSLLVRPAAQPKPRKESPRAAVDLPEDIEGELSAMAMAFAMAGAPADLVAEASGEGEADTSPDADGGATK